MRARVIPASRAQRMELGPLFSPDTPASQNHENWYDMKTKKILILAAPGFFLKSGYYFRVIRDCELLSATGYDPEIMVITREGMKSQDSVRLPASQAIKTLRSADTVFYENIGPLLFSLLRAHKNKRDVAVVHGAIEELNEYSFRFLKKILYKALLRYALRRFCGIISISKPLTDYLVSTHNGTRHSIHLVPNLPTSSFVDRIQYLWDENNPSATKEKLNLDANRKYICYSGNTQVWQKPAMLIEAFSQIQNQSNEIDLIILTRDQAEFRALLERYSINPKRVVLKTVENTEVPDYLFVSDVLYLVRDQNEVNEVACPTKGMEYLASGRPIVASRRLGDISDLVEIAKGVTLDSTSCNDASQLAHAIVDLSSNNAEYIERPDFDNYRIENFSKLIRGLL
jgi:glycosyltransferase involved in cell wall biosynthesis